MRYALPLFALLLLARPVRAEEPPAASTPEDVARELLSADAAERGRGEAALVEAVARGAEPAEFVRRMTDALRALANRDPGLVERSINLAIVGTPDEREHAVRLLRLVGPPALERLEQARLLAAAPQAPAAQHEAQLPQAPAPAGSQGAEPAQATPDPLAEPPPPIEAPVAPTGAPAPSTPAGPRAKHSPWTLKAWAASVPEREIASILPKLGAGGESWQGAGGFVGRGGPAEWAPAWAQTVLRSADAQQLGEANFDLWEQAALERHLGAEVRYRRAAVPSKGGAWAVETDTLHAGLTLTARIEGRDIKGRELDLEARWVYLLQPMATETTRPAPGVGSIELDRPDWSVARRSLRVSAPEQGRAALLVLPGLLPESDRHLVVVLSLLPR